MEERWPLAALRMLGAPLERSLHLQSAVLRPSRVKPRAREGVQRGGMRGLVRSLAVGGSSQTRSSRGPVENSGSHSGFRNFIGGQSMKGYQMAGRGHELAGPLPMLGSNATSLYSSCRIIKASTQRAPEHRHRKFLTARFKLWYLPGIFDVFWHP